MKLFGGVWEEIDKIIWGFIWNGNGDRSVYWVLWDICCLFKEYGGLGLRKIRDLNDVFLVKLEWNFF